MQRYRLIIKAARELGFRQIGTYAAYQGLKRLGYWHAKPVVLPSHEYPLDLSWLSIPEYETLSRSPWFRPSEIVEEAECVVAGEMRWFGGTHAPFSLSLSGGLRHWSEYETALFKGEDVKYVWEPARFGWAFPLMRAYCLTRDDKYAKAFWNYFQDFQQHNPLYLGPNWSSAQEVGIRIFVLVLAAKVFLPADRIGGTASGSPRLTFDHTLANAIAAHARRIPPTLVYARAQDNNHLLIESAALYTAGVALPGYPDANRWRSKGWRIYHEALQRQINVDGVYMQQSTNYHRLMLQSALWMHMVGGLNGDLFPEQSLQRIAESVKWLLCLVGEAHGNVPNLGPNDGAYILPLGGGAYADYRPVLHTACTHFLESGSPFGPGPWDEMATWFQTSTNSKKARSTQPGPVVLKHSKLPTWLFLRTASFKEHRPGHADLLHVNIWYRDHNIALDPGTYLYNAPPPWENSLASAFVHNTVTVDGADQMTPAGRFLYVDRASTQVLEQREGFIAATQDSYDHLGVKHLRRVSAVDHGWCVEDVLTSIRSSEKVHQIRLHWLLPDWEFQLENSGIRILSPAGWVKLSLESEIPPGLQLVRGGEKLSGEGPVSENDGWFSGTYGSKTPALAFSVSFARQLPVHLISNWQFPEADNLSGRA